jgi:uncharacterized membrane protein (UPF0127 family)
MKQFPVVWPGLLPGQFMRPLGAILGMTVIVAVDLEVMRGKPCETIEVQIGKERLQVEVARNEAQREKGLMNRGELGANEGMLFVLPKAEQATFWMKDTEIPLTIAYLDGEGRILEMHDMRAEDETIVSSKSGEIRYALEMREHWFEGKGIELGAQIETMPDLGALTPQ